MKLKTIEKYVRYSRIPYPEIISRAVKAGWLVKFTKEDEEFIHIEIKNPAEFEFFETCYYKCDIHAAAFNVYTP